MDGQNNDQNLAVYDEFVARHEVAYAGFRRYYTLKTPPPTKAILKPDRVSQIVVLGLAVVMVASIIVSGTRTIEEFGGEGGGTVAFVMIEGGIMMYAFFRARRTASAERLAKTVRWATAGLIFTLIVGIGANIDSELRSKGIMLPTDVTNFINLLVGISAPALAFISSDVLAIELMAGAIRERQNEKDYQEAYALWQDGLNRSWASQQKTWAVKPIFGTKEPKPSSLSSGIPMENVGILPSKSTLGFRRKPDAAKKVREYLDANPEAISGNPLEIAAALQVGKSTVYEVIKEYKK